MIDAKKVAHLARLNLSADEESLFGRQLEEVLAFFEALAVVNTEGIEPMVTPVEVTSTLRADVVEKWQSAEEAVAQAPEKMGHLFKVPPVV